jgi:hypothetical protein
MELREQLEFCRKCTNRELNSLGAIVCVLTHKKPDFEGTCPSYIHDTSEPVRRLDDTTALSFSEIESNVSPEIYSKLRVEQRMIPAMLVGFAASIAGAILWALFSYLTHMVIGYMAILIGAMVGFSIRYTGRGFEMSYALMGAFFSLFGCAFGNLLTMVGFAAHEYQMGFFEILSKLSIPAVIGVMVETFRLMDVLFYGIAIYEGFRFAHVTFTEKSLWKQAEKYK